MHIYSIQRDNYACFAQNLRVRCCRCRYTKGAHKLFSRHQNWLYAVFSVYASGDNLLFGDLTGNGTGGCPTDIPATTAGLTSAALATAAADPNCFHFSELISGGFTPSFGGEVTDTALLAGLRGETGGGLNWSVSAYYGQSIADFFINNIYKFKLFFCCCDFGVQN